MKLENIIELFNRYIKEVTGNKKLHLIVLRESEQNSVFRIIKKYETSIWLEFKGDKKRLLTVNKTERVKKEKEDAFKLEVDEEICEKFMEYIHKGNLDEIIKEYKNGRN